MKEEDRLVNDVCNVFEEVVGMKLDPNKEKGIIHYWMQQGWKIFDFRLVIEFIKSNEEYFSYFRKNPTRLNLRGFLNGAGKRKEMLEDLLISLKFQKKKETEKQQQVLTRKAPMMKLRCGAKIPVGDKVAYEAHNKKCFEEQGLCFFPAKKAINDAIPF